MASNIDNNQEQINNEIIIARTSYEFLIRTPNRWKLIQEGPFGGIKLKGSGYRFNMPWNFYTLICCTPISKTLPTMEWNNESNDEIKMTPTIEFQITDVNKFYDHFCGAEKSEIITPDSIEMELLYAKINDGIREMVGMCEFDYIKSFKYEVIYPEHQTDQAEIQFSNKTTQEVKNKILSVLGSIYKKYGVHIMSIGFQDVDLSNTRQAKEEEKKNNQLDNEMKIATSNAEKQVKTNEIAIEMARLNQISKLLEGLNPEQKAEIIAMMYMPQNATIIKGGNSSDSLALLASLLQKNITNENIQNTDENENTGPRRNRP